MTDRSWKESKTQVARALEQETTEPLAALLFHNVSLELDANHRPRVASQSPNFAKPRRPGCNDLGGKAELK
jgi:hypothetical protein